MKNQYALDLHVIYDDLWYELERISEGQRGHICTMGADNKRDAAHKILKRLKPFIVKNLEQVF